MTWRATPGRYVGRWREAHPGRPVIAVMPMNFPRELALAAGVLPVVVQDDQEPVSEGRAFLPEFYCGYTRNLADQAATGRFDLYDAVLMADHCIQLVGADDVIRALDARRAGLLRDAQPVAARLVGAQPGSRRRWRSSATELERLAGTHRHRRRPARGDRRQQRRPGARARVSSTGVPRDARCSAWSSCRTSSTSAMVMEPDDAPRAAGGCRRRGPGRAARRAGAGAPVGPPLPRPAAASCSSRDRGQRRRGRRRRPLPPAAATSRPTCAETGDPIEALGALVRRAQRHDPVPHPRPAGRRLGHLAGRGSAAQRCRGRASTWCPSSASRTCSTTPSCARRSTAPASPTC